MRAWLRKLWALRGAALSGLERFPVALLWLAAFVLLINLDIAGVVDLTGSVIARSGAASGAAAAIATAWVLLNERRQARPIIRHGGSLAFAALFGAAIWFWERLAVAPPALLVAAILAVPLAPYPGRDGAGFWAFLWALTHAVALAFVAVIIFCLGVTAILASLEYLFGLEVDWPVYGHVWSIGLGFVGPLFALALVPASFPDRDVPERTDILVAGLRILSDFVAVPLVAAYALILHAYALKILFTGEVPRNQVGWMVLSFGLAVLALRILVHPFRDIARAQTRMFLRFWPLPLVVPLALLAGAVAQRIAAYGLTPERYGLALFAVFLGLVLLAQVHPRIRGDVRIIPAVGAICLLLASIGPWGMLSASAQSQTRRLMNHLAAAGALDGERLTALPDLQPGAVGDVQSIIAMLDEIGQLRRLRPLFAGRDDDPFAAGTAQDGSDTLRVLVRRGLNVDRLVATSGDDGRFWTDVGTPAAVALVGYDVMVPFVMWGGPGTTSISLEDPALTITVGNSEVAITGATGRTVFPAHSFRQAISAHLTAVASSGESQPPLFIETSAEGRQIGALLENLNGRIEGDDINLESGRMTLFLRRADWKR